MLITAQDIITLSNESHADGYAAGVAAERARALAATDAEEEFPNPMNDKTWATLVEFFRLYENGSFDETAGRQCVDEVFRNIVRATKQGIKERIMSDWQPPEGA